MLRLIHTADVHLDAPLRSLALRDPDLRARLRVATRTAFTRIVDAALDQGAAALLIAGDLFDGDHRGARTAAFLAQQFDRLYAAGVEVFAVRGNHDHAVNVAQDLRPPPNVHVFSARGGKRRLREADVWVHGVSFDKPHARDSLLPRFGPPVAGAVNIGLMHSSLNGAPGHDPYAPCAVSALAAHGFDYWALGHVHARRVHSRKPWIVMPGAPQGRDVGESGPKSATRIDIDGDALSIAEIPTSAAEFMTLDVVAPPDGDDDAALRAAMAAALRDAAEGLASDAGVVRLRLTGSTPARWRLVRDHAAWTKIAADLAQAAGPLALERLVLALSQDGPGAAPAGAVGELAALMADIAAEPGFAAAAQAEVEALLADLPPAARAALADDPDAAAALAQSLAADGAERVLALMRGGAD